MSVQQRREAQFAFLDRPGAIMIAKTALNAGPDVPDIKGFFRLGDPDHLLTQGQEGGRGRRRGQRCIVLTLLGASMKSFSYQLSALDK
jgi:ATP-dependent helicase YprA (DUF1998 family)